MPIDSPTSLGTKVNAIEPIWTRKGIVLKAPHDPAVALLSRPPVTWLEGNR